MNQMDNRNLIANVFVRTPLWDWCNPSHFDTNVMNELWDEVAQEMNFSRIAVKSRWKKLRHSFKRELRNIKKALENGRTTYTLTWPYFFQMQFIKYQFNHLGVGYIQFNCDTEDGFKELSDSGSGTEYTYSHCELRTYGENRSLGERCYTLPNLGRIAQQKGKAVKRKRKINGGESCSKRRATENSSQKLYEEIHLLKSLIHHNKEISPTKKLVLDIKIQEMIHYLKS